MRCKCLFCAMQYWSHFLLIETSTNIVCKHTLIHTQIPSSERETCSSRRARSFRFRFSLFATFAKPFHSRAAAGSSALPWSDKERARALEGNTADYHRPLFEIRTSRPPRKAPSHFSPEKPRCSKCTGTRDNNKNIITLGKLFVCVEFCKQTI